MDLLTAMKNFVAIIESGGIARAARKNNAPPSVLSKQLAWLEKELETTLIIRTTRRLDITETGKLYYEHAKNIISQVNQANQAINALQHTPQGKIKIDIQTTLSRTILSNYIKDFFKLHPKLVLFVSNTGSPNGILDGVCDIAINSQKINSDALIRKNFVRSPHKVYAAPEYIKKYGRPQTIEDLKYHNCLVRPEAAGDFHWHFSNIPPVQVKTNLIAASGINLIRAVKDGLGLMHGPDFLFLRDVENGTLEEIKLDAEPIQSEFFLYYKPTLPKSNVQLLVNYLLAIAEKFTTPAT